MISMMAQMVHFVTRINDDHNEDREHTDHNDRILMIMLWERGELCEKIIRNVK